MALSVMQGPEHMSGAAGDPVCDLPYIPLEKSTVCSPQWSVLFEFTSCITSERLDELFRTLGGLSFGPHRYAGRKGAENQKHAPGRPSGKRKPAATDPTEHKPSKAKTIPDKEETPSEDDAPAANVEHIDEEEVVEEIIYEEEEARPVAPPRPKVSASARKTGLVESSSDSGHSSGSGSDDDSDDDDDDEDDDDDDGDDDASSGSDDDS
jgi:hypothetical protein